MFKSKIPFFNNCTGSALLSRFAVVAVCLLSVFFSACHTNHKGNRNTVQHHVSVPALKSHEGHKIVAEAKEWVGTPYRYASSEKSRGTDCSGLVLSVYEKVTGIKLPRNSAKQAEFCKKIKKSKVAEGDLVFFATGKDPDRVSHVGIMIDSENFIHASTKKGVVISNVTTDYYTRTFIMYGRVPGMEP